MQWALHYSLTIISNVSPRGIDLATVHRRWGGIHSTALRVWRWSHQPRISLLHKDLISLTPCIRANSVCTASVVGGYGQGWFLPCFSEALWTIPLQREWVQWARVWECFLHQCTLQEKNIIRVWGLGSPVAAKDVMGGNTSYIYSLLLMATVPSCTGMTPLGQ